jgi:hypothetical protein
VANTSMPNRIGSQIAMLIAGNPKIMLVPSSQKGISATD